MAQNNTPKSKKERAKEIKAQIETIKGTIKKTVEDENNLGVLNKMLTATNMIAKNQFNTITLVTNSIESKKMIDNFVDFDRAFKKIREKMGYSIEFEKAMEYFNEFKSIQEQVIKFKEKLVKDNIIVNNNKKSRKKEKAKTEVKEPQKTDADNKQQTEEPQKTNTSIESTESE